MKQLGSIVLLMWAGCSNQTPQHVVKSQLRSPNIRAVATKNPSTSAVASLGEVRAVALSNDRRVLAVGTLKRGQITTGTVTLRDGRTNALRKQWEVVGGVTNLAFSRDGTRLAVAGAEKISLWQVPSGRLLHTAKIDTGGGQYVITCAFSPDGKTLAVSHGRVLLYDVTSWKIKRRQLPLEPPAFVNSVAYSPNGKFLATTAYDGFPALEVFDARTCKSVFSAQGEGIGPVVFSPDSHFCASRVVSGEQSETKVWRVSTGKEIQKLNPSHAYESVMPEAFSPDGRILAGQNVKTNRIELWRVRTGKLLRTLSQTNTVAFWADERALVTFSEKGVQRLTL